MGCFGPAFAVVAVVYEALYDRRGFSETLGLVALRVIGFGLDNVRGRCTYQRIRGSRFFLQRFVHLTPLRVHR